MSIFPPSLVEYISRYFQITDNLTIKIRNFQEIRFSSKPDIMGINRLETMSVVRLTYS
ncbi:hypothetical protein T4C_11655 [Trichinella pseudospiralis]|uniref:Uncharacterized protein n=1 Tax=Trichinella pseudospiralis TaxID=6337 RepID=A0A0V1GKA9_TRIPS|nr:hypothetical protein T4C_11655 [Trichinella pseudospiralis]